MDLKVNMSVNEWCKNVRQTIWGENCEKKNVFLISFLNGLMKYATEL